MRLLKKILFTLVAIVVLTAGLLFATGHEFGQRPTSSVAQYVAATDTTYIEANGLTFGYISKGEGPLILMFHGYPETAHSWNEVQEDLANAGYQAVAIHMRGYAPTQSALEYSIASLGADVVGLIDAFGAERATIVGHDWGASAVYQAAYDAPDKIDKLIALSIPHPRGVDPSILLEATHFIYYQLPSAEWLVWSHEFEHIKKIYEAWSPTFTPPQAVLDDIKTSLMAPGGIASALGYYHSFFSQGTDKAGPPSESTIKVPTFVIFGSDEIGGAENFAKASPAFVNGYEELMLENIGHFPQLEAPKDVSKAIIAFLKSN